MKSPTHFFRSLGPWLRGELRPQHPGRWQASRARELRKGLNGRFECFCRHPRPKWVDLARVLSGARQGSRRGGAGTTVRVWRRLRPTRRRRGRRRGIDQRCRCLHERRGIGQRNARAPSGIDRRFRCVHERRGHSASAPAGCNAKAPRGIDQRTTQQKIKFRRSPRCAMCRRISHMPRPAILPSPGTRDTNSHLSLLETPVLPQGQQHRGGRVGRSHVLDTMFVIR
jgi:hypothetical protein